MQTVYKPQIPCKINTAMHLNRYWKAGFVVVWYPLLFVWYPWHWCPCCSGWLVSISQAVKHDKQIMAGINCRQQSKNDSYWCLWWSLWTILHNRWLGIDQRDSEKEKIGIVQHLLWFMISWNCIIIKGFNFLYSIGKPSYIY